jgi:hypothetical protein
MGIQARIVEFTGGAFDKISHADEPSHRQRSVGFSMLI